jgi:hypothetical protein
MLANTSKKNKITLEDYDFEKDIKNRLVMSSFTLKDVEVLEEILNSSIRVSVDVIADNLNTSPEDLKPSIEKLEKLSIFKTEGKSLIVDKEMRKYYEFQILKFDEDFKPSMEFLQGLLKKVPIHALPTWYLLPRSSDNIFDAIVEKFLVTPQVYRRYLADINFPEEVLSNIMEDVFNSKELKVRSKVLREKYKLSREDFEEHMLTLEFSFVCCLSYTKVGNDWKEVVTPFHEWGEFIRSSRTKEPSIIKGTSKIKKFQPDNFSFVRDMGKILKACSSKKCLVLEAFNDFFTLPADLIKKLKIDTALREGDEITAYVSRLIRKISQTKLADVLAGELHILNWGEEWLVMNEEDKAFNLYRHPLNKLLDGHFDEKIYPARCVRDIERNLEGIKHNQWVFLDEFLQSMTAEVGDSGPVKLEKKGRNWRYSNPEYTENDLAFIKAILTQKLRRLGVVETGDYEEKPCIRMTEFGHCVLTFNH